MILKQLIKYENAPAIEATWVEIITLPQREIEPGVLDLALRTQEVVVKCHAYSNHPEQMAQLRADLGADAAEHEALIAEVEATYEPPVVTPEQKRAELTNAVTALRWSKETGGLTLSNGITVGTKTEDQNRITTVIANAQLAGVTTVDFKAASGWVTLTLADVQTLAAAIALHVQACFSAERAHHEAIAALDDASMDSYDITTGWPA